MSTLSIRRNRRIVRATIMAGLAVMMAANSASALVSTDGPSPGNPAKPSTQTATASPIDAPVPPVPGDERGSSWDFCPPGKQVEVKFDQPQRSVQATFSVVTGTPPNNSPVWVEVIYVNSYGGEHGESWIGGRPTNSTVPLPADGRGLNDIVKVTAVSHGDPENFTCTVSFSWAGALPTDEHLCFSGAKLHRSWDAPQRNVQGKIFLEQRASSVNTILYMNATNSIGYEVELLNLVGTYEGVRPGNYLVPDDGLGVYNVKSVDLRMWTLNWWDVLQCIPSVSSDGPVTAIESRCFAGQPIEVTFSGARRAVQARVTIEARRANPMNLYATFVNSVGSSVELAQTVGGPHEIIPRTEFLVPSDGRGVFNVQQLTITMGGAGMWETLLACSPVVTEGGPMTASESACFTSQDMVLKADYPLPAGRAVLDIEARRRATFIVYGTLTSASDTNYDYGVIVGGGEGIPPTQVMLPESGGIDDLVVAHVRVATGDWPALLQCSVHLEGRR